MNYLYETDSYAQECDAEVMSVAEERFVVLDQTVFYPQGGGQPADTGIISRGDEAFKVTGVRKSEGKVLHEVESAGLKTGDKVKCRLDWQRRYMLMRMHTAAHMLSAVLYKETGALITGNQLDTVQSRIDFSLEQFDKDALAEFVKKANDYANSGVDLKVSIMPRDEAMKIPGVVKLANALPPEVTVLRVVEIPGIDIQADGGTHVRNTKEVGEIVFVKAENKGKNNRRMYFTVR